MKILILDKNQKITGKISKLQAVDKEHLAFMSSDYSTVSYFNHWMTFMYKADIQFTDEGTAINCLPVLLMERGSDVYIEISYDIIDEKLKKKFEKD
jgi:hypothetical protein